eukprot:TRINITY_DN996_c0_g1_i4.p1 TRINITY_DN996_c0_g1~~TRINITY_DN996_c0_g1_i4.p1  ORF type:complete len:424 (-),score=118.05 TRINITY_DN996_c0_g1_i4:93-1364(-)
MMIIAIVLMARMNLVRVDWFFFLTSSGTSACPSGRFFCLNKGFKSHFIPSSRVRDGLCDCCDGSDEVLCEDVCRTKAEELNAEVFRQLEAHESGLKALAQYHAETVKKMEEKKEEQKNLQEEQTNLKAKEVQVNAQIEDLQNQALDLEEELKLRLTEQVEAETEIQFAVLREKRLAETAELQDQAQRGQGSEDTTNRVETTGERLPVVEAKQELEESKEVEEEEGDVEDEDVQPSGPKVDVVDFEAEMGKERDRIFNEIMERLLSSDEKLNVLKEAKKTLEDNELKVVQDRLRDIDGNLGSISKYLGADFGPDSRFAYLYNSIYTFSTHEYEYKLEPYKEAKQAYTSIGRWTGWTDNYNTMQFMGGQRCWGGPDRSLTVRVVCGADTVVEEVREPAKCEYSMTLRTPGACREAELVQLRGRLI